MLTLSVSFGFFVCEVKSHASSQGDIALKESDLVSNY